MSPLLAGRRSFLPFFVTLDHSHVTCYVVNMIQKRRTSIASTRRLNKSPALARMFGCARFVYNWALRLRTDAYYQRQERISYADTSAALTALKREPETTWLNEVSSVPPQQALRHLDRAFRHFFEGRAKYPDLQEEARAAGGGVYHLGLPLGCGEAHPDAGEDGRAARHSLVARLHWRRRRPSPSPGSGWTLLRLLPGGGGDPAPATHCGGHVGWTWGLQDAGDALDTVRRSPTPTSSPRSQRRLTTGPAAVWRANRKAPRTARRPVSRWRAHHAKHRRPDALMACTS